MEWVLIPWVIAATILLFVALYWLYGQEKRLTELQARYQKLLQLADEAEQPTIAALLSRLVALEGRVEQQGRGLSQTLAAVPHTLQGLGLVRYNAFEHVGGDQSFSLALVDAQGNGAVLTGLHGRGDVRVYAKGLKQWRSSHSLSPDEQRALAEARQMAVGAPETP